MTGVVAVLNLLWFLLAPVSGDANSTKIDGYVLLNMTRNWFQQPQVQLSVGSPPQPMQFALSFTTAELTVGLQCDAGQDTIAFDEYRQQCCNPGQLASGCFDANRSTTFRYNNTDVTSYANYTYVTDTVGFGINGTSNVNVTGAVVMAQNANASLGLAPKGAEVGVVSYKDGQPWPSYDTLPYMLHDQGLTGSSSFAYYSGGWNPANTPQLLFGGLDTSKFVPGTIAKVPIVDGLSQYLTPNEGSAPAPSSLNVMCHGLSITAEGQDTVILLESSFPATLNPLMSSLLPGVFLQSLVDYFGWYAYLSSEVIMPCSLPNVNLTLNISGIPLSVPLKNFAQALPPQTVYSDGSEQTYSLGDTCMFSASGMGNPLSLMTIGREFFDFAYLAVDYDNYELALAQLEPTTTDKDPNIEVGQNSLPHVTKAPMYSSTSTTLTFDDLLYTTATPWTTFASSIVSQLNIQSTLFTYIYPTYSGGHLVTGESPSHDFGTMGAVAATSQRSNGVVHGVDRSWSLLLWSTLLMLA